MSTPHPMKFTVFGTKTFLITNMELTLMHEFYSEQWFWSLKSADGSFEIHPVSKEFADAFQTEIVTSSDKRAV